MKHVPKVSRLTGVRPYTFGIVLALAASAVAQQTQTNPVLDGIRKIADASTLSMTLDGTETIQGRGKRIHVDCNFLNASTQSGTQVGMVEIVDKENGAIVRRTAGDGQTLYLYATRQNEFVPISYGPQGGDSVNYYAKLVDALVARVDGNGVYPVRFLRDILYRRDTMGSSGVVFHNWLPGFAPKLIQDGDLSYVDPVNPQRTYRPNPSTYFVHYANGDHPTRSLTLQFDDGSNGFALANAYYTDRSPLGTRERVLDWRMSFETQGLTFGPDTFRFVPPPGARAVPPPKID